MLIYILGKKVSTRLIEHSLSKTKIDTYKPFGWVTKWDLCKCYVFILSVQPDPVKITLGFNTEGLPCESLPSLFLMETTDKRVYGMMMYHRNRLIMPYVRVGMQLSAGYKGVGVIGVIEADFLQVPVLFL